MKPRLFNGPPTTQPPAGLYRRAASVVLTLVLGTSAIPTFAAEPVVVTFSGPPERVPHGDPGSFWINALNTSPGRAAWSFPDRIVCTLESAEFGVFETAAEPVSTAHNPTVHLEPNAFARREYRFDVPDEWRGEVTLALRSDGPVRFTFMVEASEPAEIAHEPDALLYFLRGRKQADRPGDYNPDSFFKQHIFGYEPFYFIAGTESPNAKFQVSIKYRLLNERGWLAQQAPWLTGLHLAYSQTSLWDLNAPSAPFLDSSYRPELLYRWEAIAGGGPNDWFQFDLQGGFQHESNGKDGDDSRSLNIAYLRPSLTLGHDRGVQLTIAPRAWIYVGDLEGNPDIKDYRGYADLRVIAGWQRGLQLSATGRLGQNASQGSLQLDLTYPLMQTPARAFSIYLHAQYFTGYGESLLEYRERTDVLRAGISLYR